MHNSFTQRYSYIFGLQENQSFIIFVMQKEKCPFLYIMLIIDRLKPIMQFLKIGATFRKFVSYNGKSSLYHIIIFVFSFQGAVVVVIVCQFVLQLSVQLVPITIKIVSSNPVLGEECSIQHYVIKFVSDLRQVGGFL